MISWLFPKLETMWVYYLTVVKGGSLVQWDKLILLKAVPSFMTHWYGIAELIAAGTSPECMSLLDKI